MCCRLVQLFRVRRWIWGILPRVVLALLVGGCATGVVRSGEKSQREIWRQWQAGLTALESATAAQVNQESFVLSKKQMRESARFKLVVEDRSGRRWLFKEGMDQVYGSMAVDRLNLGIGLPTVLLQPFELNVNGRKLKGSLQPFVENTRDLFEVSYLELPQQAIQQMAVHHVVGWAILNHHVHPKQFLVTMPGAENIYRIDNSVEWFLLGEDALAVDYATPLLWESRANGYLHFFRLYLSKAIEIDLSSLFSVIAFIQDMPDEIFLGLMAEGLSADLSYMSGASIEGLKIRAPELSYEPDTERFRSKLLMRKRNLVKDFKAFYRTLAEKSGRKWVQPEIRTKCFLEARTQELTKLRNEIEGLKVVRDKPAKSEDIQIASSARAHNIVQKLFALAHMKNRRELQREIKEARTNMEALLADESDHFERRGLQSAIEVLKLAEQDSKLDIYELWRRRMSLQSKGSM